MVSRVPSPAWGWQEAAWGGGREGLATSCYPGPEVPLGVGLGHALGEAFALSSWLWSGLRTGTWESVSGQAFPAPGGGGGAVTQKREALPASPRRPSCSPVGESGTARAGGADLRLPSPPARPAPSGHTPACPIWARRPGFAWRLLTGGRPPQAGMARPKTPQGFSGVPLWGWAETVSTRSRVLSASSSFFSKTPTVPPGKLRTPAGVGTCPKASAGGGQVRSPGWPGTRPEGFPPLPPPRHPKSSHAHARKADVRPDPWGVHGHWAQRLGTSEATRPR